MSFLMEEHNTTYEGFLPIKKKEKKSYEAFHI